MASGVWALGVGCGCSLRTQQRAILIGSCQVFCLVDSFVPCGWGVGVFAGVGLGALSCWPGWGAVRLLLESLILAQDERWRRA